jgi:Fur family ferric uptake transcriptional regulator
MGEQTNLEYTLEDYLERYYLFLEQSDLRNTYERNLILTTIYEFNGHFTFDDLLKCLNDKRQSLTVATLYKCLELFEEAGLIIKHCFSQNKVEYEKFYPEARHNHLYIKDSNKVIEFSDSSIEEIIKYIEETYNITTVGHSFTIYGKTKTKKNIDN